jgi:hypothetical protein
LAQSSCTDHAPTSGSFVASLNFLPHDGHEKCFMCSAGPRPFFGCISHSFAGPTTSPPHFRHFTKRFSPLFGRSRMADMKVQVDLSRLLLGPWVGCNMNGGAFPHVQPVELPWASHTPWLVYECFKYGTLIYSVGLLIYRNSAEPVKSKFRLCEAHINRRSGEMNGDSKKAFAVALASFAVGAVIATVAGNTKARGKLAEVSKKLVQSQA